MIGTVRNNLRAGQLYPMLRARLQRFRAGFGEKLFRVGFGIRSYESYWASALAMAVLRGQGIPNVQMLDHLVTQPRRWRHLIGEVAQVFPQADLVVLPFERTAGQPDKQLETLTDMAPGEAPQKQADDWLNAAPRLDTLRNRLLERGDFQQALSLPDGAGRWMPFNAAQRQALRAQYLDDLNWLKSGADGLARLADMRQENNKSHKYNDMEVNAAMEKLGAQTPAFAAKQGQKHGEATNMV